MPGHESPTLLSKKHATRHSLCPYPPLIPYCPPTFQFLISEMESGKVEEEENWESEGGWETEDGEEEVEVAEATGQEDGEEAIEVAAAPGQGAAEAGQVGEDQGRDSI